MRAKIKTCLNTMTGVALALALRAGVTSLLRGQNHEVVALQLLPAAPVAASGVHLDRYRFWTTANLKPGAIYRRKAYPGRETGHLGRPSIRSAPAPIR